MPITRKLLGAMAWRPAFEAEGVRVFQCGALGNDFAIVHEKRGAGRTAIIYNAFGRKFTEPGDAIRHYNEVEKGRQRARFGG